LNLALLSSKIQQFITEHLRHDPTKLLLKYKEIEGIPFAQIMEQIQAKARCQKKLPTWFSASTIYFPNKLNIEQTSSEQTANYKASLVKGTSIIDVTGGFGVDCYAFSKQFQNVTHCEISSELSEIVSHNYKILGVSNIKTVAQDGIQYLKETKKTYDCIYIDPSRRNDTKGKVFFTIVIKTAPLLDITNGLRSLKNVKEIHVVAVQNEVKELLWILDKNKVTDDVLIKTINLKKETSETFAFFLSEEKELDIDYALPKTYIYEPNAAILKAGGFLSVAKTYNLKKLHLHSHLYTSDALVPFPGRRFEVKKTLPYTKKIIKKELNLTKAQTFCS